MPPDIRGRHTSPASANESNSNTICSAKVIRWFTTRQHSGRLHDGNTRKVMVMHRLLCQ